VTFGDALTLLGLAIAVLLFQAQREQERRRALDAAFDLLSAVRDGILPWGELYFRGGYDEETARQRAQRDFDYVMTCGYGQVFHVPTEPLAALIASPAAGGLIGKATVEAANVALWQLGVFNQLVRQQTDFNASHLAEIRDGTLPQTRRQAIADAAYSLSGMLHAQGIGDASWYAALMRELEANMRELADRRAEGWWRRPALALATLFVVGAIVAATWTGIDRGQTSKPNRLPVPATTTTR
jgi:hypothetical protein